MRERKEVVKGLSKRKVILVRLRNESAFLTKDTLISIVFKGLKDVPRTINAEMEQAFRSIHKSAILPVSVPPGTHSAEITYYTSNPDNDLQQLSVVR